MKSSFAILIMITLTSYRTNCILISNKMTSRIAGKVEFATLNKSIHYYDTTYMASISYLNMHKCGGAIIARHFVLTAAHCTYRLFVPLLKVRVGTLYLDKGGYTFGVVYNHIHPRYNSRTHYSNLAILQVDAPILKKLHSTRYIAIHENPQIFPLTKSLENGIILGWGLTSPTDIVYSPKLLKAKIKIMKLKECRDYLAPLIVETFICAQSPDVVPCIGDHGGPLAIGKNLFGVIGWNSGCNFSVPTVITYLQPIRQFIYDVANV